jgi:hypothetical protein
MFSNLFNTNLSVQCGPVFNFKCPFTDWWIVVQVHMSWVIELNNFRHHDYRNRRENMVSLIFVQNDEKIALCSASSLLPSAKEPAIYILCFIDVKFESVLFYH